MNSFGEDEDGDSPPPAPEPSAEPSETETAGTAYGGSLFLMYLDKARLLILARLHRLVLQKRRKKRPRRRITRLREAIQLGALGALARAVGTHAEGDRIYARANVERAELTEYYS